MRSGDPKRREERAKIAATWFNNVSVLVVGGGLIGPLLLGTFRPAVAIFSVAAGFLLHLVAQGVLEFVARDEPSEGA